MALWSRLTGKDKLPPPQSEREIEEKETEVAAVLDEFAAVDAQARRDIDGVRRNLDNLRHELNLPRAPRRPRATHRDRSDLAQTLLRAREQAGGPR